MYLPICIENDVSGTTLSPFSYKLSPPLYPSEGLSVRPLHTTIRRCNAGSAVDLERFRDDHLLVFDATIRIPSILTSNFHCSEICWIFLNSGYADSSGRGKGSVPDECLKYQAVFILLGIVGVVEHCVTGPVCWWMWLLLHACLWISTRNFKSIKGDRRRQTTQKGRGEWTTVRRCIPEPCRTLTRAWSLQLTFKRNWWFASDRLFDIGRSSVDRPRLLVFVFLEFIRYPKSAN
jgi:hypothetical protein